MTRLRKIQCGVIVAAALNFVSINLKAECRCIPPGSPKYELDQSIAVFSGKVIGIKKSAGMTQRVTLKVFKTWKGRRKSQVVLMNSTDPEKCGFDFHKGQSYLVYAKYGEGSRLTTTLCSRTGPLELADKDIQEFNNNGITSRHPAKN